MMILLDSHENLGDVTLAGMPFSSDTNKGLIALSCTSYDKLAKIANLYSRPVLITCSPFRTNYGAIGYLSVNYLLVCNSEEGVALTLYSYLLGLRL
jgi:hypothetical protein